MSEIIQKLQEAKRKDKMYACFIKTETTGVWAEAPITKLTIVKTMVNDPFKKINEKSWIFNPQTKVSKDALSASGLTIEELEKASPMSAAAVQEILGELKDSILLFWHPSFDATHLLNSFSKCGIKNTFAAAETVSIREMAREYMGEEKYTFKSACEKAKVTIGNEVPDAEHLRLLFTRIIGEYHNGNNIVPFNKYYDKFSTGLTPDGIIGVRENHELYFLRGKHAGDNIELHKDYLRWLAEKADVSIDTKKVVFGFLRGTL